MKTLNRVVLEQIEDLADSIDFILEGIDEYVDKNNKIVKLTDAHEYGINTSLINNPVYWKTTTGHQGISIFERTNKKRGRGDGNPLVYAIKGIKGWKLDISSLDIKKYLRRFLQICNKIKGSYDTIIVTPSTNNLNNRFMEVLSKQIKSKYNINNIFKKAEAEEAQYSVYLNDIIKDHGEIRGREIKDVIDEAFEGMGFYYTAKNIPPEYRKYITKSIEMGISDDMNEKIEDKDIVILDDTVASGTTLSTSINTLLGSFNPKSITVITLFSPKL